MIMRKKVLPILVAVLMVFAVMPITSGAVHAEETNETALSGDALNGCKVRIR